MNKASKFMTAAGVLALGFTGYTDDAVAAKKGFEKCYGVVKAGKNDCGAAGGAHSCAGFAKTDGDGNEWVFLPEGTCERIVGGKLEPKG